MCRSFPTCSTAISIDSSRWCGIRELTSAAFQPTTSRARPASAWAAFRSDWFPILALTVHRPYIAPHCSRSGVGSRLLVRTIDRLAERVRYRIAARRRSIRLTDWSGDSRGFNSERSRLPKPIHDRILRGVTIMKKIFAAIALATLLIGWTGARVSAQENTSPSRAQTPVPGGREAVASLLQHLS